MLDTQFPVPTEKEYKFFGLNYCSSSWCDLLWENLASNKCLVSLEEWQIQMMMVADRDADNAIMMIQKTNHEKSVWN